MQESYEVLVVGAGPAGCAAAISLAQQGIRTLLIDRDAFPRDKVCGDGLTPGATSLLAELGVLKHIPTKERNYINNIRFVTPRGQYLTVPFRPRRHGSAFMIIPRKKLDFYLWQRAKEAGAEFRRAVFYDVRLDGGKLRAVRLQENGKEKEISTRILIGADGATSRVARCFSENKMPPASRFLAIRAYLEGMELWAQQVEFFWTGQLKPGYFWIFPLSGNRANVGMGIPADLYHRNGCNLHAMFEDLLKSPHVSARLHPDYRIKNLRSWSIPLAGRPGRNRVFPGTMLVGDAGYWVDPLSGEGIYNALRTGMMAAQVAAEALEKGRFDQNFLHRFEHRAWQELGPTIRRSLWFVRGMRYLPQLLEAYFYLARKNHAFFQRFFSNLSSDFEFDFSHAGKF